MPGELLSKKLTRGERGDVSLSGSQHFAAGAPRGEHGNTTLPSASSRRVSLPFTQFPAHLGGPFRYSFDTKTHSRQGISPSARRLIAGLLLTQAPAPLEAPSTRCPALVDAQPPPSSMRSLARASSSFISRGRRALSFSYLSKFLPSDRSLSGFLHSPFVAGFFRAFMRVCTPTNTRKQEKRSSPSAGVI